MTGWYLQDKNLKVLEFNCRFGDPETQPIMMRLKSDLADLCFKACESNLSNQTLEWDEQAKQMKLAREEAAKAQKSAGGAIIESTRNPNVEENVGHAARGVRRAAASCTCRLVAARRPRRTRRTPCSGEAACPSPSCSSLLQHRLVHFREVVRKEVRERLRHDVLATHEGVPHAEAHAKIAPPDRLPQCRHWRHRHVRPRPHRLAGKGILYCLLSTAGTWVRYGEPGFESSG